MAIIEARNLVKRFGAVAAADDLTVAIGADSVVGLIGANGAGKTLASLSAQAPRPNRSSASATIDSALSAVRPARRAMPDAMSRLSATVCVTNSCGIWNERQMPRRVTARGASRVTSWPSNWIEPVSGFR